MINTHTQGESYPEVNKLMEDRVALITNASQGIGAVTAKHLARHGAAVGVNYYSNEIAARQVVDAIETEGGRALAVKADVKDIHQVEVMVQQVTRSFGLIDTLVLNSSDAFPVAPFLEYQWEDFEANLLRELKSAFYPCKAVVPFMVEQKWGCIIAVSTNLSRYPIEGFCAHSTAKSGLDAFVKTLALELGPHGIRVNAVAPELTMTDATSFQPQQQKDAIAQMTPLRRNGLPDDVAGAILLLASEEARFITGAYLPVSGGIQIL